VTGQRLGSVAPRLSHAEQALPAPLTTPLAPEPGKNPSTRARARVLVAARPPAASAVVLGIDSGGSGIKGAPVDTAKGR
jgi:hypothetical protein